MSKENTNGVGKHTAGPLFVRSSADGRWFVDSEDVQRVALFRNESDARRFVGLRQPADRDMRHTALEKMHALAIAYCAKVDGDEHSFGEYIDLREAVFNLAECR